ncbi:WS/DGAT/MGAT family O-acyltransferase [Flexivirga caeni]|uniref:Diacylglycerol O-acyltransferase n=1 Tax=Flexivirga caeni TaxID=2294115 RepID=A0A3M9MCF2_9MICO|nr:wax ester/triacylglycerol synthase family O-acyltransferase [Flexivirga caeni]RNI23204.1 wax ester/triacylglycerol synthase family O-acyltransferase [Flexivirga caeni]
MADRLSALDASFFYLQDRSTPMHVGSVLIFEPTGGGFDYEQLVGLVSNRIAFVPRYRQKVRQLPARLLPPMWVDDDEFDVSYHVRRSALPKPGTAEQLEEFVGRVQARPLDPDRPLWELYLVDGLAGGRFAIVTKTHIALVDGIHAIDIGQIIVDPEATREHPIPQTWRAARPPNALELVAAVAGDVARNPRSAGQLLAGGIGGVVSGAGRLTRRGVSGAASATGVLARMAASPAPDSVLNRTVSAHRRFVMVSTGLDTYRRVRAQCPESVTVHDVVLATITGALRGWLLARGEAVPGAETVRALVPLSVEHEDGEGEEVSPMFVDLPVGEARPMMRLHQIAYATAAQLEGGGPAVDAASIAGLAGFAPPTLHSLGARLGNAMSRRMFNLVVTNVPGPQRVLYAGDAPMVESYPVIPLPKGQTLSIGLTSYNGRVDFGLTADRDAMPDLELFGQCLADALAELLDETETRP